MKHAAQTQEQGGDVQGRARESEGVEEMDNDELSAVSYDKETRRGRRRTL